MSKEEWKVIAGEVHRGVHGSVRSPEADRVSYVICAYDNDEPFGYITVQERSSKVAYFQWGGVFPCDRGTVKTYNAYKLAIEFAKKMYDQIETRVENVNVYMLRLAMKVGFLITGVSMDKGGRVFLELTMEVRGGLSNGSNDADVD